MSQPCVIDPNNLSNLLFSSKLSNVKVKDPYVHPHIAISTTTEIVAHGRGLVAKEAIAARSCLFVTPPTVKADKEHVRSLYMMASSSQNLQDICEQELLQSMKEAIDDRNDAVVSSFLALVGAEQPNESEAVNNVMSSMEILLGKSQDACEELRLRSITDHDLRQIIRRNAFGPDFCTYDNLQSFWSRHPTSTSLPPHILGIYPLAAMINHSCVANAVRVYVGEVMVVHASRDIQAGEEIVWSYLPPTLPDRRERLRLQHGFVCHCQRCTLEQDVRKASFAFDDIESVLQSAAEWNERLIDVVSLDSARTQKLVDAYKAMEDKVFASSSLSNEYKRYLRVGYTQLHINFLNIGVLMMKNNQTDDSNQNTSSREDFLMIATQLHFSFCACHNASTEHISILHLCYELISTIHQSSADQTKTLPKLQFWTEQVKKAHMIRYGNLGNDLESVRTCMVHTSRVLRQKDALLTVALYPFI